MSDGRLYLVAGLIVCLIVAALFLVVWLHDRRRRHLLYFTAAYGAAALAAFARVLELPPDAAQNAVVSTIVHTFATLTLVEGLAVRFGREGSGRLLLFLAATIIVLVCYFTYFERDLLARFATENLGLGLMVVAGTAQVLPTARRRVDHAVLALATLFALLFFARALLVTSLSGELFEMGRQQWDHPNAAAFAALFRQTPYWMALHVAQAACGFLLGFAILASITVEATDELKREGRIDPLSGLDNRRGFAERAQAMCADAGAQPLSLVLCDVDRLAAINDMFGQRSGDRLLATLGGVIAQEIGSQDGAARLGGGTFALLLARTNMIGASRLAERLRSELDFARLTVLPAHAPVSVSIGIAERAAGEDAERLTARADARLSAAKQGGHARSRPDDEIRPDPPRRGSSGASDDTAA